jgi:bifunctional N-acetylglucosamine-1-phosphate-uridyltransferase/glucosamine-1-phosphate-acetyltransferase GlmU-like protein
VSWRGVITALDPATRYRSRIAVYQHPLAGRPVLWHVVTTMMAVDPPPDDITVLHRSNSSPILPSDPAILLVPRAVEPGMEAQAVRRAIASPGMFVFVDGRAPLVEPASLLRLLRASEESVAALGEAQDGAPVAVAGEGPALAAFDDPLHPTAVAMLEPASDGESMRIEDRAAFARAAMLMRDRIVRRHQEQGVSFMLPATNWVDIDVTIGADTLLYPGVLLEGQSEVGNECVIGPHCRIVESRIGRGVEMKGWNYVTHTSIRNHAVLDPYVRRGYD